MAPLEVIFLGVGEAFDERLPNTSVLLKYQRSDKSYFHLLLDCGFTAPPELWKQLGDKEALDAIWISHFHGDHFMGIPPLLVRFWEEQREKPLTLISQKGIRDKMDKAIEITYPGFKERMKFEIRYLELEPGESLRVGDFILSAAESEHSQRNLSLRVDLEDVSLFYSGDGRPTKESKALSRDTGLLIHESFHLREDVPGHGTVMSSIEMAKECGIPNLALVHIHRYVRRDYKDEIGEMIKGEDKLNVFMPEPGDSFFL